MVSLTRLRWLRLNTSAEPWKPGQKRRPFGIEKLIELRYLSIGFCKRSLNGLEKLEKLKNLETLDLYPAHDVDRRELLAGLIGLKKLRNLELHGAPITNADLRSLARLRSLRFLGLRDTRVTDTGLVHLLKHPKLREVNMVLSGISSKAAEDFHRRHGTAVVLCCTGD